MKKLEDFNVEKIELNSIYGGGQVETTFLGCDVLDDTNGNGKPDPGECVEWVVCPE